MRSCQRFVDYNWHVGSENMKARSEHACMVDEHKFGGWLVSGNAVFDNRGAGGDTAGYCNMGDG